MQFFPDQNAVFLLVCLYELSNNSPNDDGFILTHPNIHAQNQPVVPHQSLIPSFATLSLEDRYRTIKNLSVRFDFSVKQTGRLMVRAKNTARSALRWCHHQTIVADARRYELLGHRHVRHIASMFTFPDA
jgi:hypothetical protein